MYKESNWFDSIVLHYDLRELLVSHLISYYTDDDEMLDKRKPEIIQTDHAYITPKMASYCEQFEWVHCVTLTQLRHLFGINGSDKDQLDKTWLF